MVMKDVSFSPQNLGKMSEAMVDYRYMFQDGCFRCPQPSRSLKVSRGNVQTIVSTAWSFAALADGILVTWGDPRCGGDSRMVQEQLGGKVMLGGC